MEKIIADEEKTSLLGYPDLFVSTSGSTESVYLVYAQPSLYRADICPICRRRNHIQQRGYQPRKINDFVIDDNGNIQVITVMYKQRQFMCVDGNHSFSERIDSFKPKERVSERLKRYIFFLSCCSETSWSKVAKQVGISFGKVASIHGEIKSLINLKAKSYESPTIMAIRALNIKGKPYTLIANLQQYTIVGFYSGRPEEVLSIKKDGKDLVESHLFVNTSVVVVDPCCNYVQELKARARPTCTIVVDHELLYNRIYEDLLSAAQIKLSMFRAKKFVSLMSPGYKIQDQKSFNFINRVLSESPEIHKKFIAYKSIQGFINKDFNLSGPEKSELIYSLKNNEYVPAAIIDDTLRIHTLYEYYGIDKFRHLCDVIINHFTVNAPTSIAEMIVDECFLCVPDTIEEEGKLFARKSVSCFEDYRARYPSLALGKSFEDIERNLKYKKEYISGERAYEGPEIISE